MGFTEAGRVVDEAFDAIPGPGGFDPVTAAMLRPPGAGRRGVRQKYIPGNASAANEQALRRVADLARLPAETIRGYGVPRETRDMLVGLMKPYTKPGDVRPWLTLYDQALNTWKGLATGPALAFHGRNFGSGQARNVQLGAFDPRDVKSIDGLLRHGAPLAGIERAAPVARILTERGLPHTAENGTKVFKELAYTYEVSAAHVAQPADVLGGALNEFQHAVPGRVPFSYKETIGKWFPKRWGEANPLAVRGGFGGRASSQFAPQVAGEILGKYTEDLNRLAPFATMLRQGYDPATAAAKVTAAHGTYAGRQYTQVENEFMRRFAPFYKFIRQQVPWVFNELMERPGGRLAKTIRTIGTTQQRDPFAPEYVQRGASVPLSAGQDGAARWLTGLGIMEEDPLALLGSPGKELLGRLTPFAKYPLELATGRNFFQAGRPLEGVDPPIGRALSNLLGDDRPLRGPLSQPIEHLLSTFVPRVGSTLKTVSDPRDAFAEKLLTLGTGARVAEVSPAARDRAMRQATEQALMDIPGARQRALTYIPADDLARLSNAEREEAQRLLNILKQLDRRGRERAKLSD